MPTLSTSSAGLIASVCLVLAHPVAGAQSRRTDALAPGTPLFAVALGQTCPTTAPERDTVTVAIYPAVGGPDGGGRLDMMVSALARVTHDSTDARDNPRLTLIGFGSEQNSTSRAFASLVVDTMAALTAPDSADRAIPPRCIDAGTRLRGTVTRTVEVPPPGAAAMRTPALPPSRRPAIVDDRRQFVPVVGSRRRSTVHASVIVVHFDESTPRLARVRILALFAGTVVGGSPARPGGDGPYYVQVTRDPTGARILALANTVSHIPGVAASYAIVSVERPHPRH